MFTTVDQFEQIIDVDVIHSWEILHPDSSIFSGERDRQRSGH